MAKKTSILKSFDLSQNTAPSGKLKETKPGDRVKSSMIKTVGANLDNIIEDRDRLQKQIDEGAAALSLDPNIIDPSPFKDRLNDDSNVALNKLKMSIEGSGQKVPIQVRVNPDNVDRYQIVYGKRRWLACKSLGIDVQAIVTELSDRELVIAQGLENSARQDLSWIEKALFASTMQNQGIKPKEIKSALNVNDQEMSRFRVVTTVLTGKDIELIGRAPGHGRRKWHELVAFGEGIDLSNFIQKTLPAGKVSALPSDDRFNLVYRELSKLANRDNKSDKPGPIKFGSYGRISIGTNSVSIKVDESEGPVFAEFFQSKIDGLLSEYEMHRMTRKKQNFSTTKISKRME